MKEIEGWRALERMWSTSVTTEVLFESWKLIGSQMNIFKKQPLTKSHEVCNHPGVNGLTKENMLSTECFIHLIRSLEIGKKWGGTWKTGLVLRAQRRLDDGCLECCLPLELSLQCSLGWRPTQVFFGAVGKPWASPVPSGPQLLHWAKEWGKYNPLGPELPHGWQVTILT